MTRYNKKIDTNHLEIKMALIQCGYIVWDCSTYGHGIPDLLTINKKGDFVFLEVKSPKGKLTEPERKFFDTFYNARRYIVRSPEQAIEIMRWSDEKTQTK